MQTNEIATHHGVVIQGLSQSELKFEQIGAIDYAMQTAEIASGGLHGSHALVRSRLSVGRVTLAMVYGKWTAELSNWLMDAMHLDKPLKRYDVKIKVYQPIAPHKELRCLTLHDAFPVAWSGPLLGTAVEQITLDSLQLAYSRLSMSYANEQTAQPVYPILGLKEGGGGVTLLAQPESLQIRQGADYAALGGPNMDKPFMDYQCPRVRELHLSWTEDWDLPAAAKQESKIIYDQLVKIRELMKPTGKPARPPLLQFKFNDKSFDGFISDLQVDIRKTSSTGMPLRIAYQLHMVESPLHQESGHATY